MAGTAASWRSSVAVSSRYNGGEGRVEVLQKQARNPAFACDLVEKTLMIAGLRPVKSKRSRSNQEIQYEPDLSSFEALVAFELVARSARSCWSHGRVCSLQQHSGGE